MCSRAWKCSGFVFQYIFTSSYAYRRGGILKWQDSLCLSFKQSDPLFLCQFNRLFFLVACAAKYSGGSVSYFPGFHTVSNPTEMERFESHLHRYFTRKIGFEAVMRIRCTKGTDFYFVWCYNTVCSIFVFDTGSLPVVLAFVPNFILWLDFDMTSGFVWN